MRWPKKTPDPVRAAAGVCLTIIDGLCRPKADEARRRLAPKKVLRRTHGVGSLFRPIRQPCGKGHGRKRLPTPSAPRRVFVLLNLIDGLCRPKAAEVRRRLAAK